MGKYRKTYITNEGWFPGASVNFVGRFYRNTENGKWLELKREGNWWQGRRDVSGMRIIAEMKGLVTPDDIKPQIEALDGNDDNLDPRNIICMNPNFGCGS